MAINTAAIGVRSDPVRTSWTSFDAILYALAVGAGSIDPAYLELAFTTDDSEGVAQRVLPTFGMVLAGTEARVWRALGDVDLNALVHAGQEFVAHREIPPEGEIEVVGWIDAVWDKGTAALAEYKSEATLMADREPLFTQTGTRAALPTATDRRASPGQDDAAAAS